MSAACIDPRAGDLLAILMVEDEDGNREPIGIVTTRREAEELAQADMDHRRSLLDQGEGPGICPWEYQIWSRGQDGYEIAERWTA